MMAKNKCLEHIPVSCVMVTPELDLEVYLEALNSSIEGLSNNATYTIQLAVTGSECWEIDIKAIFTIQAKNTGTQVFLKELIIPTGYTLIGTPSVIVTRKNTVTEAIPIINGEFNYISNIYPTVYKLLLHLTDNKGVTHVYSKQFVVDCAANKELELFLDCDSNQLTKIEGTLQQLLNYLFNEIILLKTKC